MSFPRYSIAELENILLKDLEKGKSLDEILLALHKEKGIGIVYLWRVVAKVSKTERREAMKIAIRAIKSLR